MCGIFNLRNSDFPSHSFNLITPKSPKGDFNLLLLMLFCWEKSGWNQVIIHERLKFLGEYYSHFYILNLIVSHNNQTLISASSLGRKMHTITCPYSLIFSIISE